MTDPKPQPHLRAVPAGGGHRVEPGLRGSEDVEAVIDAEPASVELPALVPSAGSGIQAPGANLRAIGELALYHVALVAGVGGTGAVVGGLTGRTWTGAAVGAGANLFLFGLGAAVFWRTLPPMIRWGYLAVALASGAGAGYALWASSSEGSGRRRA